MQFEVIEAQSDLAAVARELRSLTPSIASVSQSVAEIIQQVRTHGDAALRDYVSRFDSADPGPLVVEADELERAGSSLDGGIRGALSEAMANVSAVAQASECGEVHVALGTHDVHIRRVPLQRAAIYVPGGRAPYPSTVVMGAVSATAAGVEEISVCSPPPVDDAVLAACHLTGTSRLYRMGGAHAVAALAYGTETIPQQDLIVGPGNLYVQEAKRQVSGAVGIDGFAGPSDLVLIADSQADPEPLALDLIAQAEHGPGTLVVAISTDPPLLRRLAARLREAPESEAVARGVGVVRLDQALELAQLLAPEHLQLAGPHAEGLAPEVTRAGCLFVGQNAATAFGDYIAGSNHVLPTNGAARFSSGLNVESFRRTFAEVRIDDAGGLARAAAPLARAEGFEYHARSMEARIRENESR